MKTCTVIFRDADDREQLSIVGYEGFEDDRGRLIITLCRVLDLLEGEVRSGDEREDIAMGIALAENLEPHRVIVDCEIEFEILEADEKKEAA